MGLQPMAGYSWPWACSFQDRVQTPLPPQLTSKYNKWMDGWVSNHCFIHFYM